MNKKIPLEDEFLGESARRQKKIDSLIKVQETIEFSKLSDDAVNKIKDMNRLTDGMSKKGPTQWKSNGKKN